MIDQSHEIDDWNKILLVRFHFELCFCELWKTTNQKITEDEISFATSNIAWNQKPLQMYFVRFKYFLYVKYLFGLSTNSYYWSKIL